MPSPTPINLIAFRNIPTCSPSQMLFDDIVDDEDEAAILMDAEASASGIDHSLAKTGRFEQYGQIENSLLCFNESFWRWSRFGDGSFGVWYGALDEETSIEETLYHRPELDRNDLLLSDNPIMQARRMFRAQLTSRRAVDLCPFSAFYPKLTADRDYSFCQSLGSFAIRSIIELYQTPSVRKDKGICVPVFTSKIIKDTFLYDYYNLYPKVGRPMTLNKR